MRLRDVGAQPMSAFSDEDQLFMNKIIYIVGVIVIVLAILSFLGFR